MLSTIRRGLIAASLLLLLASTAQAQTIYSSRANFETDNPGLDVETFENAMVAPGMVCTSQGPLADPGDGVCYGSGDLLGGVSYNSSVDHTPPQPDLATLGAGAFGAPSNVLGANFFVDSTVLTFEAANNGAVGFDLFCLAFGGPTATVSVFGEGGLITQQTASCNLNTSFFGVATNERITEVVVTGVANDGELVDNVTFSALPILPAEPIANFAVWKDFDDDNAAMVEVTISCNTGLPLQQSKSIGDNDADPAGRGATQGGFAAGDPPVTFVVTDFNDGELDCEITEEVPSGYTVNYYDLNSDSPDSCDFQNVAWGEVNQCVITNTLNDVDVDVTKVWIDENPQFSSNNFADARWECANTSGGGFASGTLEFFGNPDTDSFSVFPDWESGTTCSVTEVNVPDGNVEVDDSECRGLMVFPGSGTSCTIVNTRLFAGIPTLSQYGLALLALLMLGVGFVAYRRFA